jgi:hypothetical protein
VTDSSRTILCIIGISPPFNAATLPHSLVLNFSVQTTPGNRASRQASAVDRLKRAKIQVARTARTVRCEYVKPRERLNGQKSGFSGIPTSRTALTPHRGTSSHLTFAYILLQGVAFVDRTGPSDWPASIWIAFFGFRHGAGSGHRDSFRLDGIHCESGATTPHWFIRPSHGVQWMPTARWGARLNVFVGISVCGNKRQKQNPWPGVSGKADWPQEVSRVSQ